MQRRNGARSFPDASRLYFKLWFVGKQTTLQSLRNVRKQLVAIISRRIHARGQHHISRRSTKAIPVSVHGPFGSLFPWRYRGCIRHRII
jgi:hypothetical protein